MLRQFAFCALVGGFASVLSGCQTSPDVAEAGSEQEFLGSSSQELLAGSATLKTAEQTVLWSGRVGPEDAPTGGEPPECANVACDHFTLKVKLPSGTFNNPNRPGGLQVALRWFGNSGPHELPPGVPGCCGEFDTLNLYVYKDGVLRGSSPGIIAVSQSALIPEAENGTYDVWIAYDPTYNVAPSVEYEALAEVEYSPKVKPTKRLLPDLAFRGTERINFDTPSFPIFEPDPPPGSSCFLSETAEDGAHNCLRFDQIIANEGRGPLELWFEVPNGDAQGDETVYDVKQRVYSSDGSSQEQPAGQVEFHGVHGHYHYSSFATTELWRSDRRGSKLGHAPVRGGQKVSFCIADIRIDAWAEKGDGPRTYYAPDCLFPVFNDGQADHFKQGLQAGWSDVYDWYIPDQYIEVSGVSDGYYLIQFCADPENSIEESDEDNNCLINHIKLTGMGTPQNHVQVLGVIDQCGH
jgi:hypothetical protein